MTIYTPNESFNLADTKYAVFKIFKVILIDFVVKTKKEYKKEYKEYTEYTRKFVLAKKKCSHVYSKEYNLVTLLPSHTC
jgi:hypothetical protein